MTITVTQLKEIRQEFATLKPASVTLDGNRTMSMKEAVFALAPTLERMKKRGFDTQEIVERLHEKGIESVFGNSFINNETFQQYACHGYLSHGLRHIKASLVIPHKTPPANQPAECSFNYPTLRHWLKACLPWCAFHDFHNKSKIGGLVHQ